MAKTWGGATMNEIYTSIILPRLRFLQVPSSEFLYRPINSRQCWQYYLLQLETFNLSTRTTHWSIFSSIRRIVSSLLLKRLFSSSLSYSVTLSLYSSSYFSRVRVWTCSIRSSYVAEYDQLGRWCKGIIQKKLSVMVWDLERYVEAIASSQIICYLSRLLSLTGFLRAMA